MSTFTSIILGLVSLALAAINGNIRLNVNQTLYLMLGGLTSVLTQLFMIVGLQVLLKKPRSPSLYRFEFYPVQ